MLKILHNICDLDFSQILDVYGETVDRATERAGQSLVEQSLYDDLSLFLTERNTACYVWMVKGRYTSCVRSELYADGILLTCLETAPEARRRGYAASLLKEVIALAREQARLPIYVHIHNKNEPSITLHKQLGFCLDADYARLVDGTVSRSYCTMKFE